MSPSAVLESAVDVGQPAEGAGSDPSIPGERALVARLRGGDAKAFEELVLGHQDRVFDFCYRMVGDREDASELVQEIFVSVHESVGKFRADSKLSTWIYRITKNQCLNRIKYLRRRGRGKSDEFEQVSEAELSASSDSPAKPDEALDAARIQRRVQGAIAKLDEEHRLLVVLRDIEGLTYDEIVEITDLPEGTVKSRLHRGRERLAEILAQLEE